VYVEPVLSVLVGNEEKPLLFTKPVGPFVVSMFVFAILDE
jgi:hypothetical protein